MTIAGYIADQLFKAGVRYVFGIPGGPSIPYIEAFRKAGIEFILTSNEASAGIMADVSARLTGIPGVCHATFGPGATNITTGTGSALLDRSPVIVLTSEMDDEMKGRTTQMNIDHQKLFEPLTKATFRLNRNNIFSVMEQALRLCVEEYPGPVHIGLPSDIADLETGENQDKIPETGKAGFTNDLAKITALLADTRRPLLAIGLTAKRLGIGKELLSFLETHRMPVVITPMAKGLIPESDPSYTGVLFHSLSDYVEDIYKTADLVIGIGYDPVEYNYESWIPDVPLIHFGTIETDIPDKKNTVQYVGSPDEWFRVLEGISSGSLIFEKEIISGIRDEMTSVFIGFRGHFGPVAALKILQEKLPHNSVITADVGSHLHLLGQFWETSGKDNLIITNGWSGMGFGIPAAMAVSICNPHLKAVCVTGDGGFLMMAGEIVTAKRYNLPIIVVVFSDGELNLIKLKQMWKGISPNGTTLYNGNLFGSDTFLGVNVLNADNKRDMARCVEIALSINEPVIINAMIDPEDYKWMVVKR